VLDLDVDIRSLAIHLVAVLDTTSSNVSDCARLLKYIRSMSVTVSIDKKPWTTPKMYEALYCQSI
jgi:hypothetical protein